MWIRRGLVRVWRAALNRCRPSVIVPGATVLATSLGAGIVFLGVRYSSAVLASTRSLACAPAALFGAICGAVCLLLVCNRALSRDLRVTRERIEDLSDQNWELTNRIEAERTLAQAREQAEAVDRGKLRFVAMVSHEIRTPLSGIIGMADLLLGTALTPEQRTYAGAVKTSGDTLLLLVDEILDFSSIEAGAMELDAKPFELNALVEETVELLAPRAHAKGLDIASYVDGGLPGRAVGDSGRLRQILLNLAGNAIKFTDKGGVGIEAEAGSGNEVVIKVRDTGIGIPFDQRERIFAEFQQGGAAPARKSPGTGLGLAICRRIIERMGGRIVVESAAGAGSVFQVSIVLPPAPQAGAPKPSPPDLADKDILIVGATAIETSFIARHLGVWGARTRVLDEPGVAVAVIRERPWHAIVVDHSLGANACEALARANGEIARRVILVRPSARHELAALKAAGFSGYLIKPVRVAALAARLAAAEERFARAGPEEVGAVQSSEGGQRGLAVLVAEDDEINALLARALLTKLGYRPTIATDGEAAIEAWSMARASGEPFAAVLMDVQMLRMDGIEATRRIRAAETGGGLRTPIIALTADAFERDRAACLEAGIDGFLVKPLDRERLADALAAAMAKPLAA